MGEGQSVDLGMQRRPDIGIGMPEAGHRRPAGTIKVTFPIAVNEIAAIAGCSDGQNPPRRTSEDMTGHGETFLSTGRVAQNELHLW